MDEREPAYCSECADDTRCTGKDGLCDKHREAMCQECTLFEAVYQLKDGPKICDMCAHHSGVTGELLPGKSHPHPNEFKTVTFRRTTIENDTPTIEYDDGTYHVLYKVKCGECKAIIDEREADRHAKLMHDIFSYDVKTKSGGFVHGGSCPRSFGYPEPPKSTLDAFMEAA